MNRHLDDAPFIDEAQRSVWRAGVFANRNLHAGRVKLGDYAVELPEKAKGKYQGFPLSERENQVLLMNVCGLTGRQIAQELGVTLTTVATYKRRILFKLGCRSMSEAAALATAYIFGARISVWSENER